MTVEHLQHCCCGKCGLKCNCIWFVVKVQLFFCNVSSCCLPDHLKIICSINSSRWLSPLVSFFCLKRCFCLVRRACAVNIRHLQLKSATKWLQFHPNKRARVLKNYCRADATWHQKETQMFLYSQNSLFTNRKGTVYTVCNFNICLQYQLKLDCCLLVHIFKMEQKVGQI